MSLSKITTEMATMPEPEKPREHTASEDLIVELTKALGHRANGSWWNDQFVYGKVKKAEAFLGYRILTD